MRGKRRTAWTAVGLVLLGLGLALRASCGAPEPMPAVEPTPAASSAAPPQDVVSGREPAPLFAPQPLASAGPAPTASAPEALLPAIGTLELLVLREGVVVRAGRAWLVPGEERELPDDLASAAETYDPAATLLAAPDHEGVFRFVALAPGPYRAVLEVAGLRLERSVALPDGRALARLVFHLGGAAVEGHVYDDSGEPVSTALVVLSGLDGGVPGARCERFARTDAGGAYRIAAAAAGLHWLSAYRDGTVWGAFESRQCPVPDAGVAREDFGAPAGETAVWTGRAQNARGEALPAPGDILLEEAGRSEYRAFPFGADGAFALRLRPGTYGVRVRPAGFTFHDAVELAPVEVPADGLRTDLVLAGSRVRLRVRLPAGWEGELEPSLRRAEETHPGAWGALARLPDGSFVRDALHAGSYVLSTHPLANRGNGLTTLEFLVGSDPLELELELVLPRR